MIFQTKKKIIEDFIVHNKKLTENNIKQNDKIFLIEFNGWSAIHIIFSYLVYYYKLKKNCKIVAYECYELLNRTNVPWYKKIFWQIGILLNIKTFKIFKSFGTDKFLKPSYSYNQIKKANIATNKFFQKKISHTYLENFKIDDIWIGDLIYDSYLKKFQQGTINLSSPEFKFFFKESLKLFYFWKDFFKKNKVEAIAGCHAVYLTGIPLRIANKKNINCFAISGYNCDLVNLRGNISYNKRINGSDIQFKFYKNFFKKLSFENQKKIRQKGKDIIKKIISGKKKYLYSKESSFHKKKIEIKKSKKNKIKVAIFAHDFIDSPHIYGNHFFPDFQKWFEFLNQMIKKTDYEWFVKEHPASSALTIKKIKYLLNENKEIKLIKKNFPNNKLKDLGINFVLTVFGTVASELPIYDIKVINASKNQPHADFNFSINPKNFIEYKNLILNLKKNNFKVDKNQLYSFHYLKEIFSKNHLFFYNQEKYFNFLNNKPLRFTPTVYKYWLDDFNLKKHIQILNNLEKFIKDENYYYSIKKYLQ